jgi:methionyl-tRNA formyltransferase
VRVLFWGTPDFALPPLRALLGEGFDVVGVVTQPDRAVGRSRSFLEAPPVKRVAAAEAVPVLQPERPRGDDFVAQLRELNPEISVVVAYGHILSQAIIDLPPRGTVNIHASLLPLLRGAAPIEAAIRQGHAETGVTIMRMVKALDAGPSILQMRTPIADDETSGELRLRLAELGALALVEALALIELGRAVETPQDDSRATYAPKIDRAMTKIDWTADAGSVSRIVRAYDPRPGAYAVRSESGASQEVKLFGARVAARATDRPPGEVLAIDDDGMTIACGGPAAAGGGNGGVVQIASVHPAGKRPMSPREWASGRGIAVGERLS